MISNDILLTNKMIEKGVYFSDNISSKLHLI